MLVKWRNNMKTIKEYVTIRKAEIKAEDRWIADVFDTYDYDEKDMSR